MSAGTKDGAPDPGGISLRPLRSSDLALMHRWLNAPHVVRWWYGEGTSYGDIEVKYLPRIEGREPVRPLAILYGETPIGYLQVYSVSHDERYARLVGIENAAGIDLFIGEKEYLHRGLGEHVLRRCLAEYVLPNPDIAVCVIEPEPNNTAAIRAYEKAGFHYFKTIRVPGDPAPEYLMMLSRKESEENGIG